MPEVSSGRGSEASSAETCRVGRSWIPVAASASVEVKGQLAGTVRLVMVFEERDVKSEGVRAPSDGSEESRNPSKRFSIASRSKVASSNNELALAVGKFPDSGGTAVVGTGG